MTLTDTWHAIVSAPAESTEGEPSPSEALSFEQALSELETLVERLESGQQGLEQDLSDFQRGIALVRHCERQLEEAEQIVYKLVEETQGEHLEAFEPNSPRSEGE